MAAVSGSLIQVKLPLGAFGAELGGMIIFTVWILAEKSHQIPA